LNSQQNRYYTPGATNTTSSNINSKLITSSQSPTDQQQQQQQQPSLKPRTRFLRTKTLSENLIQLPQTNIDVNLTGPNMNQKSTTDSWNRNSTNGGKRIKTAIGLRNHYSNLNLIPAANPFIINPTATNTTPITNPPPTTTTTTPNEITTLTNSVFKQSINQKYQQNILSKSAFLIRPNSNSTPTSTTNAPISHRELSIIDLQLPVNRSFTVAGAHLTQQQLMAISKRNNINRINDYYSITNSTDYTHHNINSNNNITSNSNNSLASKIILTTLNTTSNKPVEQYVQRTIKSAAPQLVQYTDYQDLLRNSSNNSVDNEFQISFPYRNNNINNNNNNSNKNNNYKYLQMKQQKKQRQLSSAKTIRRPMNSSNSSGSLFRNEMPITNDYLNNISSETLLIRRLKFT
jgi:hypothetical protein